MTTTINRSQYAAEPVVIQLPFPPSTNNLFVNAGKRGRLKSERYSKWQDDAGWLLKAQRPGKITGPVEITVSLCAPDKRKRDADNANKAVLDFLVLHQIIEADDNTVVKAVSARWVDEQDFPCVVSILPAIPADIEFREVMT